MAVQGALVQMISHGFISAALFLCVGVQFVDGQAGGLGEPGAKVRDLMDLNSSEFAMLAVLAFLVPGLGIWPAGLYKSDAAISRRSSCSIGLWPWMMGAQARWNGLGREFYIL